MTVAFDRANADSPFLGFVKDEFAARGSQMRTMLADKIMAHEFVRDAGLRTPERFAIIRDIDEIGPRLLPKRCVLKYAKGWSARGVFILERIGNNTYFDHLSLRSWPLAALVEHQRKVAKSFGRSEHAWILEELIDSTVPGKVIPFDYKFYCFREKVGLIIQIDRNTNPPKLVLFDGDFVPLRPDHDYVLASPNAKAGTPLVPLHAPALIWWASELSLRTDSPFVSIDLYDSAQGPVFGEFTFSPGGTVKRMWMYSHETLDRLDSLFREALNMGNGSQPLNLQTLERLPHLSLRVYGFLASYAYNNGVRGADRFANFYLRASQRVETQDEAELMRKLHHAWTVIRDRMKEEHRYTVSIARSKAGLPDLNQALPSQA